MSQPFSIYPDSFDGNTLSYHRFGERGGSLVDVVNGKVLTAYGGVTPLDDGYRFDGASGYLGASFATQPERTTLTLECWLRGWALPLETVGSPVVFYSGSSNQCRFWMRRRDNPATSMIGIRSTIDGTVLDCNWVSADADALLASASPLHIAAVRDGTSLGIFVNGILRRNVTVVATVWSAGTWLFNVGARFGTTFFVAGVLDEVRLSASARYAADFPITRFQDGRRAVVRGPGMQAGVFAGIRQ